MSDPSKSLKIALNFTCICVVWGSTYLAIKFALNGIPTFVVPTLRYLLAFVVLIGIARVRRETSLSRRNLGIAAVSGVLLSFGNALVCFSETALPSGLVAVVIGSLPAWIIVLDWKLFGGSRPLVLQVFGVVLSLIGVAALTNSQSIEFGRAGALIWAALFSSVVVWAFGSLLQRRVTQKQSIFTFSAVQSLSGGVVLAIVSAANGSLFISLRDVPMSALWAVLYLSLAGTVAATTSYVWLTQNSDPKLVSTYALITPIVAVWVGWAFADESVTILTVLESLLVIAGVAMIALTGRKKAPPTIADAAKDRVEVASVR